MIDKFKCSMLFSGMEDIQIENCIKQSNSQIIEYKKDEIIFYQHAKPTHLLMLVEGSVVVCNDNISGKRNIVAKFENSGELFGEVFIFLKMDKYDHYAQAVTQAKILQIPKDFFYNISKDNQEIHSQMVSNMLSILAEKAYFLNKKLQILSGSSLRQKIAKLFLSNNCSNGKVNLSMNREDMADFLNTARPSLSRELMNMHKEGLIRTYKKDIYILDFEKLQDYL